MKLGIFKKSSIEFIKDTCPFCKHKLVQFVDRLISGDNVYGSHLLSPMVTCFNFDLGVMSYDYFLKKYKKDKK